MTSTGTVQYYFSNETLLIHIALAQSQYLSLTTISTASILLKDLEEPRAISVDPSRSYLYVTTYYGTLIQLQFTSALQSSDKYSVSPSILSHLPPSIRIIHEATTFSRFDGMTIMPSYVPSPLVPTWNQV